MTTAKDGEGVVQCSKCGADDWRRDGRFGALVCDNCTWCPPQVPAGRDKGGVGWVNQPDRVTRTASLMTLAFTVGIASQVELIPETAALYSIWVILALALIQLGMGVAEHGRSLMGSTEQ